MRLIAARTLEHGLRLLKYGDPVRKVIEEDIRIVREDGDCEGRHKEAKRRKMGYTVPGELLLSSRAMLYLAKHRGYPNHGLLRNVSVRVVEAASLANPSGSRSWNEACPAEEIKWQDENIDPAVHYIFDHFGEPVSQVKNLIGLPGSA
jgi:hypothetical protein